MTNRTDRWLRSVRAQIKLASGVRWKAELKIPVHAKGVVVMAPDCRDEPQRIAQRQVVAELHRTGFATLQPSSPMLTKTVQGDSYKPTCSISTTAQWFVAATDWLAQRPSTKHLNVGYFGAQEAGMAALAGAAARPATVRAIVALAGHPNPASLELRRLRAPTLAIVGRDPASEGLNRQTLGWIQADSEMAIVNQNRSSASNAKPSQETCRLALRWFNKYLAGGSRPH